MEPKGKRNSVVIVDDEPGILHGLRQLFEKENFTVYTAEDRAGLSDIIATKTVDIAILDIRLKNGLSGLDLLALLRNYDADLPVLMVTGYGSIDTAVQAMKLGAVDYIQKPIENRTLLDVVRKNLELLRLRKDNSFLRNELLSQVYQHRIITADGAFLSLIERADRVKNSSATLLLTGESGTGKEVLSRYIHFTSNRRDGPFVGINCAAISETLLLSELFGHEKGSFTGATERHLGKFELADKGTLFLDEIGDMSPAVQAKLLRVLEESAFERVGGTKRIEVDIRLIAATNRDLGALIQKGEFRSDLYYRIAVMELPLPPLRERPGDIPLLVDHFISLYAQKYRKPVRGALAEVLDYWRRYDWPGNVRELQNAVNQAVLLCRGEWIDLDSLGIGPRVTQPPCADPFPLDQYQTLDDLRTAVITHYEGEKIKQALAHNDGNHSRTAKALGITRKTLAAKMRRYGI